MIPFAPPALQEPAQAPDAEVLLEQGRELRGQKKWPEAVAVYSRMLALWQDHQLALFERAQTLSWMKRFDESIRDFKRHLAVYPELAAESEPALARVTAWSRRFKEAVHILEPYAARGDRQATLDTATFLSWDGQLNRSLAMTGTWLGSHPGDREFLILRARVLGWRGLHGQARQAYEAVLTQSKGDREALLGLAQLDLWKNRDLYKVGVYRLPKHLDEEVARLHLEKIGAKLTKLSPDQAKYLGVPVEGPYKPEHYRY